MNKTILIIALLVLVGGGLFIWKRKAQNGGGGGPIIPPIAPTGNVGGGPWVPERQTHQMPTGYAQIGGYQEQPTQNPGITQSFAARKGGCGKCGLH